MTRTYALKRLLEHGPMTRAEIEQAMGGNVYTARRALERLVVRGELVRKRGESWRPVYDLH